MKNKFVRTLLSPGRLFSHLRRFDIENKGLKITALVLALLLFFIAQQPQSDIRLSNVPLEFTSPGRGMEISGDVPLTVSVRLRGPRDIVRSLTPNQISVLADLSKKEPGERRIQLRPEDVSKPEIVEVVQIDPASFNIRIEPTKQRVVNIRPQFLGQVSEGLEVYRWKITPSQLEIEGPQSLVERVSEILTETINLDDRRADFRLALDVETPYNSLRIKTPGPIIADVEIGEIMITRTIENIDVSWLNQQPGYRLLTKTISVEVKGPKSAINSLRPEDIYVECRSEYLNSSTATVIPKIHLPTSADRNIEIQKIIPGEVKIKKYH